MKRLLVAAGVVAAILAPAAVAAAHNPHIECVVSGAHAGQVHFWATDYNTGSYRVNGGNTHPFTGGFDLYLDGATVQHGVITAPDWPTFDDSRGPCAQPTPTTVRSTTSTSTSTSSTSTSTTVAPPRSTTSTSTTGAPPPATTQPPASSTSTTPPTTAPSSTSSGPSTTAGPTSTTPVSQVTPSPPVTGAPTLPSAPAVEPQPTTVPAACLPPQVEYQSPAGIFLGCINPTLPSTGSNAASIALIAAGMFAAGALLIAATRRRVKT